jgi:hypothetical protein
LHDIGHFQNATRIEFPTSRPGTESRLREFQMPAVEEK